MNEAAFNHLLNYVKDELDPSRDAIREDTLYAIKL